MDEKNLPSRMATGEFENEIYNEWLEKGYFHADENSKKPPYSIVIPPPNVTGSLHMGHALNNTLQDIMARYHRLKGYEVLWMPGTDHAGIATQNVVERQLAAENISRHDIGRDAFIDRVWKWRAESGGTIINQLKRLGASCDWERERFTMDEGLSHAVRKVFVTLFKEDLIYRSNYMVNWCPRCHTALSDLEVEFYDRDDFLYYLQYPVVGENVRLTVATTRPETYLGDSAVCVHPEDPRFKGLIGKTVKLPVIDREIPIIADEYVDMEFGTGCLKITPAHDPNDFEIGKRHNLESINMMDENGCVNSVGGEFAGLDRVEARKKVIEKFTELGFMGEIEDLKHSVGHCYRCKTVVEPRISMQWFVKIKPLAEKAIEVVENGRIRIVPEAWEKNYYEWMYNIRDWCISRQIWWGHQIPAWYCEDCGHINVDMEDPTSCEKCGCKTLTRETDVLDTWFSSALWPFSTQGWPEENATLSKFYPTSCLITGFDILFFWVARMIMMGMKFMDEVPFKDVYIHALVRDQHGQKMSKSKGNVIDPLTVIDEYGVDAFRFTLAAFAAQGRDIKLAEDRIAGYRNFVNKIWNASRFIMMNLDENTPAPDFTQLEPEDHWILAKLQETAEATEKAIVGYNFNEAAGEIYKFFWNQLCDWYIEFIKRRMYNDVNKVQAQATAKFVLEKALIILHPFMPFVTEYIYRMLNGAETIQFEAYPSVTGYDAEKAATVDAMIELVTLIRNIRGEYNVNPGQSLDVTIVTTNETIKARINAQVELVKTMAKVGSVAFSATVPENSATNVATDFEVAIPLEGLIDVEAELKRLEKEKKALEKDYNVYGGKLKNEKFLASAPADVIEKDKAKFAEVEGKLAKLNETIDRMKAM